MLITGAMGIPGGGRTFITERVKRHFNTIGYCDFSPEAISTMFTTIVNHFFAAFDDAVKTLIPKLVEAQKHLFKEVLADLLPTPSRAHYLFNLRDIWKVFLGVCALIPKKVPETIVVARCWTHEVNRVFGDRLIDDGDRVWLKNKLDHYIKDELEFEPEEVIRFSAAQPHKHRRTQLVCVSPLLITGIRLLWPVAFSRNPVSLYRGIIQLCPVQTSTIQHRVFRKHLSLSQCWHDVLP